MSARSYDARHRAYDARHRSSKSATLRPGRLIAGLALPTAAAAALTFTATGAAFATASHPATGNKNITLSVTSTPVSLGESHSQARQADALAREHAAFSAARSSERQDIAARNLVPQRAAEAPTWQLPTKQLVFTPGLASRRGRPHAPHDQAGASSAAPGVTVAPPVPAAAPAAGWVQLPVSNALASYVHLPFRDTTLKRVTAVTPPLALKRG